MTASTGTPPREDVINGSAVLDCSTGELIDATPRYCEIFGGEKHELKGTVPEYVKTVQESLSIPVFDALNGGAPSLSDIIDEDEGYEFTWTISNSPSSDEQLLVISLTPLTLGDTNAFLVNIHSTDKNEDYYRALETYRHRLEIAMYISDMSWWEINVQTGEVEFHENRVDDLGWSPADFQTYEDFLELVHADDMPSVLEARNDILTGEASALDITYRSECHNGGYRWVRDIATVSQHDSEGNPSRVTGISVDITSHRQTEKEVEGLVQELTVLNQILRHDVQSDMSVALGWLDNVRRNSENAEMEDVISRAIEACEHTVDLTKEVRKMATTLTVAAEFLPVKPIHIHPYLQEEKTRLEQMYEDTTVELDINDSQEIVEANPLISSVLSNITNNAVLHNDSGEERTVRITMEADDGASRISISDNGPGISKEKQETLFEITDTNSTGESGFGLPLTYHIVRGLGGNLWLDETGPDGSTFVVELRRATAANTPEPAD